MNIYHGHENTHGAPLTRKKAVFAILFLVLCKVETSAYGQSFIEPVRTCLQQRYRMTCSYRPDTSVSPAPSPCERKTVNGETGWYFTCSIPCIPIEAVAQDCSAPCSRTFPIPDNFCNQVSKKEWMVPDPKLFPQASQSQCENMRKIGCSPIPAGLKCNPQKEPDFESACIPPAWLQEETSGEQLLTIDPGRGSSY